MKYEITYETKGKEEKVSFNASSDEQAEEKFAMWWAMFNDYATVPPHWVTARWAVHS